MAINPFQNDASFTISNRSRNPVLNVAEREAFAIRYDFISWLILAYP